MEKVVAYTELTFEQFTCLDPNEGARDFNNILESNKIFTGHSTSTRWCKSSRI